jgi:PAS domain S-box-containing protein
MKRKRHTNGHPLFCWDIIIQERSFHQLKRINYSLYDYQIRQRWDIDLDTLLKLEFDAVVLTNIEQEIIWVSNGFHEMTGYTSAEIIGRKSSFLQGEKTSAEVRQHIRHNLSIPKPVAGTLVNYRKDGTPYQCRLSITPLFDHSGVLRNYIALEKEIKDKV